MRRNSAALALALATDSGAAFHLLVRGATGAPPPPPPDDAAAPAGAGGTSSGFTGTGGGGLAWNLGTSGLGGRVPDRARWAALAM